MKIMTVLGTRPEIIRLSRVIALLDRYAERHWLVHTGQNFDERLSDVFFQELGVRAPDEYLGVRGGSFGEQAGQILAGSERLMLQHRPDRLLVLGDTNSCLAALPARRLGIPVYHMEAGNRCFDDRVPEEVNRRVIDHCSTVLMPYSERSRANLVREGFAESSIYVTGNPIKQVMDHHAEAVTSSRILEDLGLSPKAYFLVTMHRAENVDKPSRLRDLIGALARLGETYGHPVVCSLHPRTRAKAAEFGIDLDRTGLAFLPPFGFFDFLALERDAFCVLSDSGTVQEETCLLGVPNVTIRDVTERPETVECGSNILAGSDPDRIARAVEYVTTHADGWTPPREYLVPHVAETVVRIALSYRIPDLAEQEWARSPGSEA